MDIKAMLDKYNELVYERRVLERKVADHITSIYDGILSKTEDGLTITQFAVLPEHLRVDIGGGGCYVRVLVHSNGDVSCEPSRHTNDEFNKRAIEFIKKQLAIN